jgi:hypothetical protein
VHYTFGEYAYFGKEGTRENSFTIPQKVKKFLENREIR